MGPGVDAFGDHSSSDSDEDAGLLPRSSRSSNDERKYSNNKHNQHHRRDRARNLLLWLTPRPRRLKRFGRRNLGFLSPYIPYVFLAIKIIVCLVLAVFILTPIFAPSYTNPPAHYNELQQRCSDPGDGNGPLPGCANPHNEKVFISMILYDEGGELAAGIWGERILDLVHILGPDNVFLSIYESDSGMLGKAALETLRARLPAQTRRDLVFDAKAPLEGLPNVTLPDGSQRIKRVAFLAALRNRALRALDAFTPIEEDKEVEGDAGRPVVYDKVLFMNDIAFEPLDAAQLLFSTNRGPDGKARYLAACAMDFFTPFRFYDTYALRDDDGFYNTKTLFPFFPDHRIPDWGWDGNRHGEDTSRDVGVSQSRVDFFAQTDAVHVKSCWGGMMAAQARYIQNTDPRLPRPDFQHPNAHTIDPAKPREITTPVRFRHEPEPYLDACECCLFSADLAEVAAADGGASAGPGAVPEDTQIVVNPYVRVAYKDRILWYLPLVRRWERLIGVVFWLDEWFSTKVPQNPYREVRKGQPFHEEIWMGDRWELEPRTGRSGMFCAARGMQILRAERREGYNFVNSKIPPGQRLLFTHGPELPLNWMAAYDAATTEEKKTFFEQDWLDG